MSDDQVKLEEGNKRLSAASQIFFFGERVEKINSSSWQGR